MTGYLILVNVSSFLLFGFDKWKARNHFFRIRESILILLSLFGGALGSLFGMMLFHHKTRKPLFGIGIPIILAIQLIIIIYGGTR